ncbi:MAG: hypothetical protein ACM3Q4_13130 [Acidobacteriota bacterium]
MELERLYDHIHTWLWRYEHTPFASSMEPGNGQMTAPVEIAWAAEMFCDLEPLTIPRELIGTIFEYHLQHVVSLAKTGQPSQLKEVYDLLDATKQYVETQIKSGAMASR